MTMTQAARYDVDEAITRLLDAGESGDPRTIAAQVADAIPPEQLRATLANALVLLVQRRIHQRRRPAGPRRPAPGPGDPLDNLVCTGHNRWKRLRDCTAADLRTILRWQDHRMTAIAAERDTHEGLLAALDRAGGHRLDDLDAEVVLHLLS